MQRIIGLTTYRRSLTTTIGRRIHHALYECYAEAVIAAGGIPVLLPPTEPFSLDELLSPLKGVVLVGGGDLDPAMYGETPHHTVEGVDPIRDRFEIEIAKWALQHDLPLLGICRGMQVLNVAAGGTLIQDIPSQMGSSLQHRQIDAIDHPVHLVRIEPDSRLARTYGCTEIHVNTGHHQAIDQVAPGFRATALAEDGIIEGIESENKSWIIGVQWHPELMFNNYPLQLRLFSSLLEAS